MARIGFDVKGIFSMDQDYYLNNFLQGLRDNPGGGGNTSKQLLIDMITKGGRGIEGAGPGGYSAWDQIYQDLQARVSSGDLPAGVLDGIPTPQQVSSDPTKWPGFNPGGAPRTEAEVQQLRPASTPAATPPATPAAPEGPDPAIAAAAAHRQLIWKQLGATLNDYGLGSLFSTDSAGNPTGWLWDQVQLGYTTPEELSVALETTKPWQDLYGSVINEQRKQAGGGANIHVMSTSELLEYRQRMRTLYKQYNYPPDFYNDVHDFDAQAVGGIDIAEAQQRIAGDWNKVANSDPLVRKAFLDYYGPGMGDAQMAAFFADPGRSLSDIDLAAKSAVIGGTGARYGLTLQRSLAERVARTGVSDAGVEGQFQQLATAAGFYRPNVGEGGGDITGQAITSQFGVSDAAAYQDLVDVEARKRERLASTEIRQSGPAETRTGVVGVGSSR